MRRALATGSLWILVGSSFSRLGAILLAILIARQLPTEEFGKIGLIQTTVAMFSVFAALGIGAATTRFVSVKLSMTEEFPGSSITAAYLIAFSSGLLFTFLFYAVAPWLSNKILPGSSIELLFRIASPLLLLSTVNGVQQGALLALREFRIVGALNAITVFYSLPFGAIGLYWAGLEGTVWALVVTTALNVLVCHVALVKLMAKRGIRWHWAHIRRHTSELIFFGVPAMLTGAVSLPANWVSMAFLVNAPNGYAEMGMFNAAHQWRLAVAFIPAAISQALLPYLSSSASGPGRTDFRNAMNAGLQLNFVAAMLVFVPVALAAGPIMSVYGEEYGSGGLVLILLSTVGILTSINNSIGQAILAAGRIWYGFAFNVVWAAILLICAFIFISMGLGAIGLALALLIAYGIHTLIQITFVRFYL